MMNIEGTPHEKALLVVSSYIIGFVSAYIAFTYAFPPQATPPAITYMPSLPDQTAAVIDSQKAAPAADPVEEPPTEPVIDLVYENQGLYLYGVAAEPLLLSKNVSAMDAVYTDDMALNEKQGLHSALPAYTYMEDQKLVYFCESYEAADVCAPYVYSLADNTLHAVRDEAGPITVATDAAAATLENPGLLRIGGYLSTSITEPWRVSSR